MHIPHQAHLSYCTNIHAGESWPEVFRSLEEYCLPLKRSLNPDTPFGIGLRLSNESSLVLAQSEELDRFKNWLQEHDLYVFTMNGFPYGAFHFARVKENVHRPDWTTSDRLTYSKRLFDILAELLPEGLDGGVSTSPISYKHWYATPIELAKAKEMATANMIDLAAHLVLLKERTGKSLHLDIEPEPDGILEDSQGFIQFYQDYLLARGIPRLSKKLGLAASDAEAAIREHLQLCYDVCHFAVGFESPPEVISTMHNLGIQIGKIQISAALKASLPEAPEELFCSEIDDININNLDNTISRCWTADGRTGVTLNGSMNSLLRSRLLAGGGIPVFFDGCSDVTICVNDIVANDGLCDDLVITRVFTATDGSCPSVSGEENPATVAQYILEFTRPSLDDVVGVPDVANFDCTQFDANDPNPQPLPSDFPFLVRENGEEVFLGTSFCNLGATFSDGPRIQTCDDTYKFVRTFTVVDWCDVDNSLVFTQLVKVGDFSAPDITAPTQDLNFDGVPDDGPLFFSTTAIDCTSYFIVPAGSATDDCSDNIDIDVFIFPNGDETAPPFGPFEVGSVA
ncbi:MAG: metabolite traffic protein EboE, partial [Bacteroidota bacterium]